jgi:hypothetical protein
VGVTEADENNNVGVVASAVVVTKSSIVVLISGVIGGSNPLPPVVSVSVIGFTLGFEVISVLETSISVLVGPISVVTLVDSVLESLDVFIMALFVGMGDEDGMAATDEDTIDSFDIGDII